MLIAAQTGTGKTTATAKMVAEQGGTCWLTDRHEDVDAAVAGIEGFGGHVGKVLSLEGKINGVPNCLHPDVVEQWQAKGYSYRAGFCKSERCCSRQADPEKCAFLASVDALKEADTIVCTKAMARQSGFFTQRGNGHREIVVLDEDPIGLLRPLVIVTKDELAHYLTTLRAFSTYFSKQENHAALAEVRHATRVADWLWAQMARQLALAQPEAVDVPSELRPSKPVLEQSKSNRKAGRKTVQSAFNRLMRINPTGTVRNVYRDMIAMLSHAAGKMIFVTHDKAIFHVDTKPPKDRRYIVLDATANAELLKPLFRGKEIKAVCTERVQPAGRLVQFMDFNGPRSYLNKTPKKLVKIIDALGDKHPQGNIVLISHKSCVESLAKATKHSGRIKTAYFGALRGRNDLEATPGNPIGCYIVAGSPKTTEEDRRQLALAVYGKAILPFADLVTVFKPVAGRLPLELGDGDEDDVQERIFELRLKGYADPRMQAIYDHTVTAELTHSADRARVLIHQDAMVYLLTNEHCPKLWYAEMCFVHELLGEQADGRRADYQKNYEQYEVTARKLLDAGKKIGNADVCRAMDRKNFWGWPYWNEFLTACGDALEGTRKVRWKEI